MIRYYNKIKEVCNKYRWHIGTIVGACFFFIGINIVLPQLKASVVDLSSIDRTDLLGNTSVSFVSLESDMSMAATILENTASPQEIYMSRVKERTVHWNEAWATRSSDFFEFFWPEAYSAFQGKSFQEFRDKEELFFQQNQWIDDFYGEIFVEKELGYWVSWFYQYVRMANSSMEGIRRLYWRENEKGELKVVGMKWIPQELNMEESYLENVASRVLTFIEGWRFAWENGDVEKYAIYYADDSVQGDRYGKNAIVKHKEITWSVRKPKAVFLSGIRVMAVKEGIQVDMSQSFRDALAYQDKGTKTLLLRPVGKSWVIIREDWSEIPQ